MPSACDWPPLPSSLLSTALSPDIGAGPIFPVLHAPACCLSSPPSLFPQDGNCLFSSVADQVGHTDHATLRAQAVDYMEVRKRGGEHEEAFNYMGRGS